MADLLATLAVGRDWLDRHAPYLLPDALVFADIGLRAAGMRRPRRLQPSRAGRSARRLIPLSPSFRTIAAAAGPLHRRYRGAPPLAAEHRARAGGGRVRRHRGPLAPAMDGATINRALAEAVRGRLSPASLSWMHRPGQRDFVLTHQLLAWLFCVWNRTRADAGRTARRLGRAVLREAGQVGGYHDLLAQQTAFLALGGWPADDLWPLIARIAAAQDAQDGGWHYFEANSLGAGEVLGRVACGWSPLIARPIVCEERHLAVLARTIHLVHRGHATALSVCALGLTARRTRGSTP